MAKLIVVDSSVTSEELAKKAGMGFIPLGIRFGDDMREDMGDLKFRQEILKNLDDRKSVGTSSANIGTFEELMNQWLEKYDEVIFMGLSKGLSGQYGVLKPMEQDFEGNLFVLDTNMVGPASYIIALEVQKMMETKSNQEIQDYVLKREASGVAMGILVEDLSYLKAGGRISPAVAMLGGLLRIKPLVKLEKGKLESLGKARTVSKGTEEIFKWFDQKVTGVAESKGEGFTFISILTRAELSGTDKTIMDMVKTRYPNAKTSQNVIPNTILIHTGPNVSVIGVIKDE